MPYAVSVSGVCLGQGTWSINLVIYKTRFTKTTQVLSIVIMIIDNDPETNLLQPVNHATTHASALQDSPATTRSPNKASASLPITTVPSITSSTDPQIANH